MKIVKDRIDDEIYIDIVLDKKDLRKVGDDVLVSSTVQIFGQVFHFGVRLRINGVENDEIES